MSTKGLVEGIGIRILNGDVQGAINIAGRLFRAGFGRPPTHVALPPEVDAATVNLYTLQLGERTCRTGHVVVGEEYKYADVSVSDMQ
jgi:hypothetical protein